MYNFNPCMCILESQTVLPEGVTLESWFLRSGDCVARSEVYKLDDGSVVAFQDTVNGQNGPLHMDNKFKLLYEGEPQYETILRSAGVFEICRIQLYNLS